MKEEIKEFVKHKTFTVPCKCGHTWDLDKDDLVIDCIEDFYLQKIERLEQYNKLERVREYCEKKTLCVPVSIDRCEILEILNENEKLKGEGE